MNYQEALQRILSLSDFERRPDGAIIPKEDLNRTEVLLERLGNPQLRVPAVHIAGTKGKGSTAALVASALTAHGYKTGLFTSPHLHTFCERLRLNGRPVPQERFASLLQEVWPHLEAVSDDPVLGRVTTFELLTAMSFLYYAQERADLQVLEVGLGGRLDSTNLCQPVVSTITSISLDHMEVLGDTIALIAREKGGIIKRGVTAVTAPQSPEALEVIQEVVQQQGVPLVNVAETYRWSLQEKSLDSQSFALAGPKGEYRLEMPLLGAHQLENAATAVATLEALEAAEYPVGADAIGEGFRRVEWPGRLEVLRRRPLVVADGAHNPYSLKRLAETLPHYLSYQGVVLVMGCGVAHDLEGMVAELASLSPRVIATRSRHPAALPTRVLQEAFARHSLEVREVEEVGQAMTEAMQQAGEADLVLATGSLFVVAEAIETVKGVPAELYPSLPRSSRISQRV